MMAEWARRAVIMLGCAILILIPAPARGDSGAQQELPPDIIVATYPQVPDTESFGPVIADAVRYRLISRGLAVSFLPGTPSAPDLEAKAREAGAAITLSCSYSVVGSQMAISLQWRDVQKRGPPVIREEKGPLDLMLDSVILKALDDLLSSVQERVKQLAGLREAAMQAQARAQPREEEAGRMPAEAAPAPCRQWFRPRSCAILSPRVLRHSSRLDLPATTFPSGSFLPCLPAFSSSLLPDVLPWDFMQA